MSRDELIQRRLNALEDMYLELFKEPGVFSTSSMMHKYGVGGHFGIALDKCGIARRTGEKIGRSFVYKWLLDREPTEDDARSVLRMEKQLSDDSKHVPDEQPGKVSVNLIISLSELGSSYGISGANLQRFVSEGMAKFQLK